MRAKLQKIVVSFFIIFAFLFLVGWANLETFSHVVVSKSLQVTGPSTFSNNLFLDAAAGNMLISDGSLLYFTDGTEADSVSIVHDGASFVITGNAGTDNLELEDIGIELDNGETIGNSTDGKIDVGISSAAGADGIYVQAVSTAAGAISRLNAFRGRVTASATATSGAIKTVDLIAKGNGAALTEVTALYGSADVNGGTVGYLRGAEFSLDDAGSPYGTATLAQGVLISNNSSGTQTTSIALDINSGTASGHKAFTYDVRLQNGETIDNTVDGEVLIGGDLKIGAGTAVDSITYIDDSTDSLMVWRDGAAYGFPIRS